MKGFLIRKTKSLTLLSTLASLYTGSAQSGEMDSYNHAVNCMLRQASLGTFVLENKTARPVDIDLTYRFHPEKPQEGVLDCLALPGASLAHVQFYENPSHLPDYVRESEAPLMLPSAKKKEEHALFSCEQKTIAPFDKARIGKDANGTSITRMNVQSAFLTYTMQDNQVVFLLEEKPTSYFHSPTVFSSDLCKGGVSNPCRLPFVSALEEFYKRNNITASSVLERLGGLNKQGTKKLGQLKAAHERNLQPTIPLVTHTVVIKKTSEQGQGPLTPDHVQWLKRTMQVLPQKYGWQHIVWVADDITPQEDLSRLGVEIRKLSSLQCETPIKAYASTANILQSSANQWHHAVNLYKYIILYTHGGLVRGLDTEITQPLTAFHEAFDLYASVDGNTERMLASGFFAARAQHPALLSTLVISSTYLSGQLSSDPLSDFYCGTGNAARTLALAEKGTPGQDMVFPYTVFSPGRSKTPRTDDYPGFNPTIRTHGIHYAEVAWYKK